MQKFLPRLLSLLHDNPGQSPTGRPSPPLPRQHSMVCPGPASLCLRLKAGTISAGFFVLSDIRWQVESSPVCWKVFLASEAKIFFVTLQNEQVSTSKHRCSIASHCLLFLPPVYSFTKWNKGGSIGRGFRWFPFIYLFIHLFIHSFIYSCILQNCYSFYLCVADKINYCTADSST